MSYAPPAVPWAEPPAVAIRLTRRVLVLLGSGWYTDDSPDAVADGVVEVEDATGDRYATPTAETGEAGYTGLRVIGSSAGLYTYSLPT